MTRKKTFIIFDFFRNIFSNANAVDVRILLILTLMGILCYAKNVAIGKEHAFKKYDKVTAKFR